MQQNSFNSVMAQRPNRNNFNLSHDVKMDFVFGDLVPIACLDVVPGDSFKISVEAMLRMAPLVAPVMHDVEVETFWFFVPNRLLWDNWEDFITGVDTDLVKPYVTNNFGSTFEVGCLADYMGIPVDIPADIQIDAFPFVAYALIWNEWFRDQNLQAEIYITLTDGDNTATIGDGIAAVECLKRGWEHDYFTSCLPWAQKGDAVTLPLVDSTIIPVQLSGTNAPWRVRDAATGLIDSGSWSVIDAGGDLAVNDSPNRDIMLDPNGTLSVNINADAVTINTLREAFRMQEFLELDAVAGSRYTETIYAHFGVRSKDSRLQRPELLGRTKGKMVISEVLQTAPGLNADGTTGNPTPQGNMAGHGISVSGGKGIDYFATEHGYIIGLINVAPRSAYQQGLPRKFSRQTREDYFWPKFANIGEQEVLIKELYVNAADPDAIFGYQSRYAEYRFEANRVAGKMREDLDFWHLGRIFASEPALNAQFIRVTSDVATRIFAVEFDGSGSGDQIYAHVFNRIYASRLMPKYGRPML